jgi:hypothetical protein
MSTPVIARSPKLPVIAAASMLYAQAWTPTDADRAAIKAYADWARNALDRTTPQEISLTVVDVHMPTVVLGWMTVTA